MRSEKDWWWWWWWEWLELSGLERLGSIFLLLFVIWIMIPGKCQIGEWKRVRSRSGDK